MIWDEMPYNKIDFPFLSKFDKSNEEENFIIDKVIEYKNTKNEKEEG